MIFDPLYNPKIFDHDKIENAVNCILTDYEMPIKERWEKETSFLLKAIDENFKIKSDSILVDYGCGIGRLAKPLIERYGCTIIGVDLMPSMLKHAVEYINSPKFIAVPR